MLNLELCVECAFTGIYVRALCGDRMKYFKCPALRCIHSHQLVQENFGRSIDDRFAVLKTREQIFQFAILEKSL